MKDRIIGVAIWLPIFVGAAILGGYPFLVLVMTICGIAAFEFGRIFDSTDQIRIPLTLLVVTVEILILARWVWGVNASHRTLTFCIMAGMVWGVIACEKQIPNTALSFTVLTTGMVYIGWLGGYFISIRMMDAGLTRFLLVTLMTFGMDIGAYLVGSAIGKHKMLPLVSPKKTWEGYIGGIAFSVLIAVIAERFIPPVNELFTWKQISWLALLISALAPLGDFGESMIKRCFGIKDSGKLIRGHGGAFDRFDTSFFALPLAYYFFELFM